MFPFIIDSSFKTNSRMKFQNLQKQSYIHVVKESELFDQDWLTHISSISDNGDKLEIWAVWLLIEWFWFLDYVNLSLQGI